MDIRFSQLPIVGDCIAIMNNQIVWDNIRTNTYDMPFDIGNMIVVEISNYDGVIQVALKEG